MENDNAGKMRSLDKFSARADFAFGGLIESRHEPQERRLPAAARPEKRNEFTRRDAEGYVPKNARIGRYETDKPHFPIVFVAVRS